MKVRIYYLFFILLLSLSCKKDEKALIVSKVKSAAKLATIETTFSKVILASQNRNFLFVIKLNQSRFAARTTAYVKAGINLQEIRQEDIKIDGKKIKIVLPAVKVLDFRYPFEEYEIDTTIVKNTLWNTITVEDHERLYLEAELDIRRKLEITGMKESTENRTRVFIENLLRGIGYESIEISFKKDKFVEMPPLDEEEVSND